MRPYERIYASVDLDAVIHNMKVMEANLPAGCGMIGVVKADGYGHGAVPVAKAIDPYVEGYAVATVWEAENLIRHGITKPILILGVTHERYNRQLVEQGIRSSVFTMEQAKKLSLTAQEMEKTAYIHLALDTGMSRIGMMPTAECADLAVEISLLPGICVEGLFTHFAKADEADKSWTMIQYDRYLEFAEMLRERGLTVPIRHVSNSAAIIDIRETSCDMVRAGISIYGIYPSGEVGKDQEELHPAMELKSAVTYVKTIEPGTAVSYGGTFVADRTMRIATIPVGYGDGYPRNLSGKGRVLIRGCSAPILGRVCMDQMMVDVTHIPECAVDVTVTLMGADGDQRISVEELAETCGGFHYEILCGIGKRVPRVYLRDGRIMGKKDYFQDFYEDFLER